MRLIFSCTSLTFAIMTVQLLLGVVWWWSFLWLEKAVLRERLLTALSTASTKGKSVPFPLQTVRYLYCFCYEVRLARYRTHDFDNCVFSSLKSFNLLVYDLVIALVLVGSSPSAFIPTLLSVSLLLCFVYFLMVTMKPDWQPSILHSFNKFCQVRASSNNVLLHALLISSWQLILIQVLFVTESASFNYFIKHT